MSARFGWAKGHGTENDFVLLPDPDGSVHGELDPALVAALCHRRRGIGADGVMRVVRSDAYDAPAAVAAAADGAEWFMDYRNADGSLAQMCGNGIRVLARWLAEERLVDAAAPLGIGTRDGTKQVTYGSDGSVTGTISVDMGVPEIRAGTWVEIDGRRLDAVHVDTGNPHAVAVVDDLASVGRVGHAADVRPRCLPGGRQRRAGAAGRLAARADAGARAWIRRDPLVRHGRLRGRRRGGRRGRRGSPGDLPGGRAGRPARGHLARRRPRGPDRAGGRGGAGRDVLVRSLSPWFRSRSRRNPGEGDGGTCDSEAAPRNTRCTDDVETGV